MNFYGNRVLYEERIHNLEHDQKATKPRQMNRFAGVSVTIGDLLIQIGTTMQKHAEVK